MNISIIGCGFVGSAIYHTFSPYFNIKIFDKYKKGYNTLSETVDHGNVIFVCVPTPVSDQKGQDLTNILDAITEAVQASKDRKIFVIKSTMLPGTTRKIKSMFPNHGFVFSPEFLTERTAVFDSINAYRIILGSDNDDDLKIVEEIHRTRFSHTLIFKTGFEESELVKYICNCFFAVKISTMNEIEQICNRMKIDYNEIRSMFLADQRIANSHTEVPGPDKIPGFGGKCLPKDLKSFIKWCIDNGYSCDMFETADNVNTRIRPVKDWLSIKGATTENNY